MQKQNWEEINEAQDFENPIPGAYIAKIEAVTDDEQKEYLKIEWDFAEGQFKGNNQGVYDRAGFWPIVLIRSYKPKALPFFKAFKTALENSNRNYSFREDRLRDMEGKLFGVVLGEEEYEKKDNTVGKRLYVAQIRSVKSIQDGDFKVPELKKLSGKLVQAGQPYDQFTELSGNESGLPF